MSYRLRANGSLEAESDISLQRTAGENDEQYANRRGFGKLAQSYGSEYYVSMGLYPPAQGQGQEHGNYLVVVGDGTGLGDEIICDGLVHALRFIASLMPLAFAGVLSSENTMDKLPLSLEHVVHLVRRAMAEDDRGEYE
jgi:hypothetical protein